MDSNERHGAPREAARAATFGEPCPAGDPATSLGPSGATDRRSPRSGRPFGLAALGLVAFVVVASAAGGVAGLGESWFFSWGGDLIVALAVVATAWRAGAGILTTIGLELEKGRVHLELATGIVSLAFSAFVLAAAGLLAPASLAAVIVLVWVAPLVARVMKIARGEASPPLPETRLWSSVADASTRLDPWLLAAPFALFFVWASLPPTFYDAVTYHLGLPNLYMHAGGLVWPERFSLAAYPQYAEMISLYPLAFAGERGAALTNYALAFGAALSLHSLVASRCGPWPALVGTLFVLGQWPFWFEAIFLKNDLLAAMLLLGVLHLLLSEERHSPRRAGVAGVLAGAAVGVKWLAGLPAILIAVAFLIRRRGLRNLLVFGVAAAALAAPWLVRNTMHHGNPVFPALYEKLGGERFSDESAAKMASATGIDIARDPVSIAERVVSIGHTEGYGSGGEVSWLLLPALVAGLFAARRRDDRAAMFVALATLVIGLGVLTTYLRVFMLPVLLAGWGVALVVTRWRSRIVPFGVAGLALVAAGEGVARSVARCEAVTGSGSGVVTGESRPADYLGTMVNHAPLARRMKDLVGPDARVLLMGSARSAYVPAVVEASYAWDPPWIVDAWKARQRHEEMTTSLTARGVTHVMFNAFDMRLVERDQQRYGISRSPEMRAWMDGWLASLELVDHENEVYLFALPDKLP